MLAFLLTLCYCLTTSNYVYNPTRNAVKTKAPHDIENILSLGAWVYPCNEDSSKLQAFAPALAVLPLIGATT